MIFVSALPRRCLPENASLRPPHTLSERDIMRARVAAAERVRRKRRWLVLLRWVGLSRGRLRLRRRKFWRHRTECRNGTRSDG